MKRLTPASLMAFVILFLASCARNETDIQSSTTYLPGKWRIVNDTSYQGAGVSNHLVIYKGRPGDYFDFKKDGKVFTKENNNLDTLSYQLISDTTIVIKSFNAFDTCRIKVLTHRHAIISSPKIYTPGGIFYRSISLSR